MLILEPLEKSVGFWVPEGICIFPSNSRVIRGKGCVAVASLVKTDITLKSQWKVAKVSCDRDYCYCGEGEPL